MSRAAKEGLEGADIYSGCCTLKIEYAKVWAVSVCVAYMLHCSCCPGQRHAFFVEALLRAGAKECHQCCLWPAIERHWHHRRRSRAIGKRLDFLLPPADSWTLTQRHSQGMCHVPTVHSEFLNLCRLMTSFSTILLLLRPLWTLCKVPLAKCSPSLWNNGRCSLYCRWLDSHVEWRVTSRVGQVPRNVVVCESQTA